MVVALPCSCTATEEDEEDEAAPGVMGGWLYWKDSGLVISGEGVEL